VKRPRKQVRSLRSQRLRAVAPRVLVYVTLGILSLTGLRTIVAGAPEPVVHAAAGGSARGDLSAQGFAESFARAYLSWDAAAPERRERALGAYLPEGAANDAGLTPGEGATQSVEWTTVAASERDAGRTLVTVAAQTTVGLTHLTVPVDRDVHGLLYLAGYPAVVGPPGVETDVDLEATGDEIEDAGLRSVVERSLANYLGRAETNLIADLASTALVSMPDRALNLADVDAITWVVPDRRVAAQVQAIDEDGTEMALSYELDVVLSDRWYVQSIHVNPTAGGIR
jgi:conjugative transposon protein TcpC